MNKKINIGIIGYGFMGHCHRDFISSSEQFNLVAVCDTNPARLEDLENISGIKIYYNPDDIMRDTNVHTLIIATPNPLHKEMAIQAARHGKHIILEKPAVLNLPDFDEMMEVIKETGVKFTVHHQRRWDRDFRIAKEVYDQRMTGNVYAIKSCLYGVNGNMHDWHVFKQMGGGMLFDWGVHLIDQMLYMVDSKIKTVFADVRNVINTEVDDYFKINLLFENHITAEIELGTYYLNPTRGWTVCGDKGTMFLNGFQCDGKIVHTTRLLENVPGRITMSAAGPTRSFGPPAPGVLTEEPLPDVVTDNFMFFDNAYKALNGEEEFIVRPEQVRKVLSVMEAARLSSRLKQSVNFE